MLGPLMNGGAPLDATNGPAYGTFLCADGLVLTLSVAHEDHFWRSLCAQMELDELADLPQKERLRQAPELRARIAGLIAHRPLEDWAARFDAARIPWSPVHPLEEVPRDPHFVARELFVTSTAPAKAEQLYVSYPARFSAYQRHPVAPAPELGQHNGALLSAIGGVG